MIEASPIKYPSLRGAMRLYLLVILATVAIIAGLSDAVDIGFLRLLSALVVAGGFSVLAMVLGKTSPAAIVGIRPNGRSLITAFLAGLAVWTPATWLLLVCSQVLGGLLGNLPAKVSGTGITLIGQALIFGLIYPVCQGFLFFGYIQTAARGLRVAWGILLTALLFGVYGIVSTGFGLSAMLSYCVVGLVAVMLTWRSGSMLAGVLVLSGFYLGEPLLRPLLNPLISGQYRDLFSIGWLTAVALFTFVTFALVQASHYFSPPDRPTEAAEAGRGWWLPLIVMVVLLLIVFIGEVNTRSLNTPISAPVMPSFDSTSPPVAPSQAPQPTDQQAK